MIIIIFIISILQLEASSRSHLSRSYPHHLLDYGYYNSDDSINPSPHLLTWMASLDDSLPISALSIPGSHDSGTFSCRWWQICDFTQCQTLKVAQQLQAGLRAFDLRVNTNHLPIRIGHGVF